MTRARRTHLRRAARLAVAVSATACSITIAPSVGASGEDVGDVLVVDGTDASRSELREAASDTVFSLRLPSGAACPGDSANDQWRVQSFVIPASEQPGDVVYGGIGPAGPPEGVHTDDRWALYAVSGSPFVDELTQKNEQPGRPGIINQLPAFSFEPFRPEHLPPGRYHLGIACTPPGRETAIYWDTEIQVVAAPEGEPAAWRWTVVADADVETVADSGSSSTLAIGGVVAIGVAGALVALRRRASRSRPAPSKEHAA